MSGDMEFKLTIVGVLLLYGAVIWATFAFIRYRKKRREEKDNKFVELVIKAINKSSIETIEDIQDYYRAYFDQPNLSIIDHERMAQLLRKASLKIGTSEGVKNSDNAGQFIRGMLSASQSVVQEEEKKVPFSGTPTPERGLLEDVLELTQNERPILRTKLDELAKAIRIRQETVDKLSEEKGESLKWAKRGLWGTVLFSAISIAITIWSFSGQEQDNSSHQSNSSNNALNQDAQ